jgi:hypothetical protein
MPLRVWYAIAGGIWGVILGPLAALLLTAAGMGLAGRVMQAAPMPPGALAWAVVLLAFLTGIGIGLACLLGGYVYGRNRERLMMSERAAARRHAIGLLAAAGLVLAIYGGNVWTQDWQYRRDMMSATERESALAKLQAERHDITDAVLASGQDGKIRLRLEVKGTRDGEYRLQWKVRDGEGGPPLLEAFSAQRLSARDKVVDVGVDMMAVGRAFRRTPAGGSGTGPVVERVLEFEAVLEPLLSPAERAMLSAEELRRIQGDQSRIRVVRRLAQTMRFVAEDE